MRRRRVRAEVNGPRGLDTHGLQRFPARHLLDGPDLRHSGFGPRDAGAELPEPTLAAIAAYYRRATTTSQPMGRLIALVMVVLLGAFGVEAVSGGRPRLAADHLGRAGRRPDPARASRTVPNAVRLGRRTDGPDEQSRLARSLPRPHRSAWPACWRSSRCGWPALHSGPPDRCSLNPLVGTPWT